MTLDLVLLPAAAFAMAAAVTFAMTRLSLPDACLDHPNHRSAHAVPIPRVGGVAILLTVFAIAQFLDVSTPLRWLLGLALVTGAVSLADDLFTLPALPRLLAHLAAGFAGAFFAGILSPVFVLYAIAIAWSSNLYNFMDGSDGLAGSMAVAGFAALGLVAGIGGHAALASLCFVIAGAAAGFLLFNWPQARIFMGDVGAVPFGFLAAGIGTYGVAQDFWPVGVPLLAFLPFAFDATLTLARRAVAGEPVWQSHRRHLYQRLQDAGLIDKRQLLIWFWGVALCCGGLAIAIRQADHASSLIVVAVICAIAYVGTRLADQAISARQQSG